MAADPRIGLETRHVFIKMEDHGLRTWHGYLNHAWDFLTGTILRLNNGPEVARKERIDGDLTEAYNRMVHTLPVAHRALLDPNAKALGVRVMVAQAERVKAMGAGAKADAAADGFLRRVEARNLDHLQVLYRQRSGPLRSRAPGGLGERRVEQPRGRPVLGAGPARGPAYGAGPGRGPGPQRPGQGLVGFGLVRLGR